MPLFGKKDSQKRKSEAGVGSGGGGDSCPEYKPSVEDKYELKELLGTGAFSQVVLAEHKEVRGKLHAIKCIDKKALKGKEDSLENEIKVLRRLKHPNIVQLVETFEEKNRVFLVMERVTGGELFDRIVEKGSYTEKDASHLMRQVLEAVDFFFLLLPCPAGEPIVLQFRRGIQNNDQRFRPVQDGGFGHHGHGMRHSRLRGSRSPCTETLRQSCRCLVHRSHLLHSFYDENDANLFAQILKGEFEFDSPYWDDISDSAKDFILHLMCVDADKRYTCKQALNHPWIGGNTASDKNIHSSVSEQLKKNFAKNRWRQAYNAAAVIRKMRMLAMNSTSGSTESPPMPSTTTSLKPEVGKSTPAPTSSSLTSDELTTIGAL